MKARDYFAVSPIVPVVVLDKLEHASPLADALLEGGVRIMEVTLRSDDALRCIENIARFNMDISVGAGTVTRGEQLRAVQEVGGHFCFSPGISEQLLTASRQENMVLIPGVASASEVMMAQNAGLDACKLFPASAVGGVPLLKGFAGPFPDMSFCPTGGISLENMNDYLALDNVACVGGSWIVPKQSILDRDFARITRLCKEAVARASQISSP